MAKSEISCQQKKKAWNYRVEAFTTTAKFLREIRAFGEAHINLVYQEHRKMQSQFTSQFFHIVIKS